MFLTRSYIPVKVSFLACLIFGYACNELVPGKHEPVDPGEQHPYFPLEIGKFIEYSVDSIVYDFAAGGGNVRDSAHLLVREEIVDTFRDNAGQLLYAIERSERSGATLPWQLRQVYSATRSATQAVRTENNLRFLKLVFPFDRRSAWDGNLWIDQYREIEVAGERIQPFVNWHYEVDSLDIPSQIGDFAFDSVLVVTEVDETNAIERRLSRVKYAKHIGVVYREQWILDSQYCNQIPPPANCLTKPWAEKAEKGYIMRQVITGHN